LPSRIPPAERPTLVLYEDPLSPWCLVAERRITAALQELSEAFGPLHHEPFPLRVEARAITRTERQRLARAVRRASREPEASGVTPDLWLSPDPPLSSIPPLAALAAARQQGKDREQMLRGALREAALFRGVNVSRRDVLYELAERAGLDVERFAGTLSAPQTERRIRERFEDALDRGVEVAPALVIGEEWLVAGPRSSDEYRHILLRYARAKLALPPDHTLH
jgi:predicted DsbA family dithiol-disulfide isomerase